MEIQRQSDYYSLDRPEIHRATLTPQQIADFTKGVGIPQGTMNTRLAWREGQPWTYDPANHVPEDDEPNFHEDDYELDDRLEELENLIPEDLVSDLVEDHNLVHHHHHHADNSGSGGGTSSGGYVEIPGLYDGSDHPSYFEPGGVGNEDWDSWEPRPDVAAQQGGSKIGGMHYADSVTFPAPTQPSNGGGGGSFGDGATVPMGEQIGGTVMPTMPLAAGALRGGIQNEIANNIGFGSSMTGQEQTPDFNAGPAKTGAYDFYIDQR